MTCQIKNDEVKVAVQLQRAPARCRRASTSVGHLRFYTPGPVPEVWVMSG